ncbi:MAG TPA: PKD domain-containing protein, partial [Thermoanaerobaculia bacterium]
TCNNAPAAQPGHFAVTYHGTVSGCTQAAGSCVQGERIDFDVLQLVDYPGCSLGFSWNFNDGSPLDGGTVAAIQHQFAAAGTYNVLLTVVTARGERVTLSRAVTVAPVVPTLTDAVLFALAAAVIAVALLRLR